MSDEATGNALDKLIGARVRKRRTALGVTQETLAEALGVTFQQIHKYESGISRINTRRLIDIAGALDIPVESFFADIKTRVKPLETRQ